MITGRQALGFTEIEVRRLDSLHPLVRTEPHRHEAAEAGDVVLVRSDPRDVPRILALSRASYRKMVQSFWWAAGHNIVAIPPAAGVLARQGIVLSPAVWAILMSLSMVIVATNPQPLRRKRL